MTPKSDQPTCCLCLFPRAVRGIHRKACADDKFAELDSSVILIVVRHQSGRPLDAAICVQGSSRVSHWTNCNRRKSLNLEKCFIQLPLSCLQNSLQFDDGICAAYCCAQVIFQPAVCVQKVRKEANRLD